MSQQPTKRIMPGNLVRLNFDKFFPPTVWINQYPGEQERYQELFSNALGLILRRNEFAICQVHWMDPRLNDEDLISANYYLYRRRCSAPGPHWIDSQCLLPL